MRMKGKGNEGKEDRWTGARSIYQETVDLEVKATGTQSGQGWGTQVEWLRSLGSVWAEGGLAERGRQRERRQQRLPLTMYVHTYKPKSPSRHEPRSSMTF